MTETDMHAARPGLQQSSSIDVTSLAPDYLSHLYPPSIVNISNEFVLPEPDPDSPLSSAPGSPVRGTVANSTASTARMLDSSHDGGSLRRTGSRSLPASPDDAIRTASSVNLSLISAVSPISNLPPKPYYMKNDSGNSNDGINDNYSGILAMQPFDEKKEEDVPDDERMGFRTRAHGRIDVKDDINATASIHTGTASIDVAVGPQSSSPHIVKNQPAVNSSPVPVLQSQSKPLQARMMPATLQQGNAAGSGMKDRLLRARRIIEKNQGMRLFDVIPDKEPYKLSPERSRTPISVPMDEADEISEPGALPSPSKRFRPVTVDTAPASVREHEIPFVPPRSSHVVTPEHKACPGRDTTQPGRNVRKASPKREQRSIDQNSSVDEIDQGIDITSSAGRRRTSQLLARYTSMHNNDRVADENGRGECTGLAPHNVQQKAASMAGRQSGRFSLELRTVHPPEQNRRAVREDLSQDGPAKPKTTDLPLHDKRRYSSGPNGGIETGSESSGDPYFDEDHLAGESPDDERRETSQSTVSRQHVWLTASHPSARSADGLHKQESIVRSSTQTDDSVRDEANGIDDVAVDAPEDERRSRTSTDDGQIEYSFMPDDAGRRSTVLPGKCSDQDEHRQPGTKRYGDVDVAALIRKYVPESSALAETAADDDVDLIVKEGVEDNICEEQDEEDIDSNVYKDYFAQYAVKEANADDGAEFDENESLASHSDHGHLISATNSSIVSGMTASTTTNWIEYLGHRRPEPIEKNTLEQNRKESLPTPSTEETTMTTAETPAMNVSDGPLSSSSSSSSSAVESSTEMPNTPVYRQMTPKRDLLSSEKSAWWLQEEFSRRSTMKQEINDAILARNAQSNGTNQSTDKAEQQAAEKLRQIIELPQSPSVQAELPVTNRVQNKSHDRPPLPQPSGALQRDVVAAFATELTSALSSLPQQNSMASMDDSEIAAYNQDERVPATNSTNGHLNQTTDRNNRSTTATRSTGLKISDVVRRLSYSDAAVGDGKAETRKPKKVSKVDTERTNIGRSTTLETKKSSMDAVESHATPQTASRNTDDNPLADVNVTTAMKQFASDTRAALRAKATPSNVAADAALMTHALEGNRGMAATPEAMDVSGATFPHMVQSPFRSIAALDAVTAVARRGDDVESMTASSARVSVIQPRPSTRSVGSSSIGRPASLAQRNTSAASSASLRSAYSDIGSPFHSNTAPVLIDTMDSALGIAKGDIVLSLLNEDNISSGHSGKRAWAGRVQDSIWRCRYMRRKMGKYGDKNSLSVPGGSLKRSSLPVDVDQVRVAGGFRSVGPTQDAALQHLRHDEIDEALDLYEDIIFTYYGYFEQSLKLREQNPGASQDTMGITDFKPYLGVALHNLGILNLLNGNCTGALSFFARAIENRKKCLGEKHPDYVTSLAKHAICLYGLHEFAAAHEQLETALQLSRRNSSTTDDRMQTAEILNNLGCLLYMCGQTMSAKAHFKECLDLQFQSLSESLYGESPLLGHSISLNISVTRANIGFVKMVTNDLPVAITALEAALMEQYLLLDGPHDTLVATMDHLAVANMLDGKHEEAAAMFGRILQLQYREFGPHDPRCHVTMEKIKMVQSRGKDFEAALADLRRTFSIPSGGSSLTVDSTVPTSPEEMSMLRPQGYDTPASARHPRRSQQQKQNLAQSHRPRSSTKSKTHQRHQKNGSRHQKTSKPATSSKKMGFFASMRKKKGSS